MIALYFILALVIAFLIWLGLQRKWKTLLLTVASLIVIIVAGWYLFLHIVADAFGTECEDNRVWKIEEYEIVKRKCIGFAGPYYYPVYLYKDDKEIDHLLSINDTTCVIQFTPEFGDTLTFDICEKKLK